MFEEDFQACVCRRFPTAVAYGMTFEGESEYAVDVQVQVMFPAALPSVEYTESCKGLAHDFRSLWRFKRPVTFIGQDSSLSLGSVAIVLIDLSHEE